MKQNLEYLVPGAGISFRAVTEEDQLRPDFLITDLQVPTEKATFSILENGK